MNWSIGCLAVCFCASSACLPSSRAIPLAESHGARDLACPIEKVNVYGAEGDTYVAEGCGGSVRYECLFTEATDVACVRSAPAHGPAPSVSR